jgi:hypothetical protein
MDAGLRWFALAAYLATAVGLVLLGAALVATRWAAAVEAQAIARLQAQHPVEWLAAVQASDVQPGGYYGLRDWAMRGEESFGDAELAGRLARFRRARALAARLGGPGALLTCFGLTAVIFL